MNASNFKFFLFRFNKIKTAFQEYGHRQRKNRHVQGKNIAVPWELTEQKGLENPSFGSLSPDKRFLQQDRA